MLGQDIERVARDDGLLDLAVAYPPRHDGALKEIGAELREDPAHRDLLDAVAGAPDSLEPTRDRFRRLHLDHEVHGTHVDPQLQRGGGDEAGELAGLQELLDHQPLLVREGAVMRPGDLNRRLGLRAGAVSRVLGCRQLLFGLLVGELVQPFRQALRPAAAVDEDDRRRVLTDELQQLGVDGGPDRAGRRRCVEVGVTGKPGIAAVPAFLDRCVGLGHVLDRHDDLQVELLPLARIGDLAFALRAHQELRHPIQGALSRREPDALRVRPVVGGDEMRQALERQRQMGTALGLGDGMDLVDDDGLGAGEDLSCCRGHHQIERLRCRDQDVRRLAAHRLALALRGVTGAQSDRDTGNGTNLCRGRTATAWNACPHTPQGRAKVALDVVGERLQRRDVDDPNARAKGIGSVGGRVRAPRQAIDAPQKCSQRLTRPGRSADQRVIAGGDPRPAQRLGGGRLRKRRLEPAPYRLRESLERGFGT